MNERMNERMIKKIYESERGKRRNVTTQRQKRRYKIM